MNFCQIVRMVQLVSINELLPAATTFLPQMLGLPGGDPEKMEKAQQKIAKVLKFLENLLDDRPYFVSHNLTLADIVAGTIVPVLPSIGISLGEYPKINAWCDRLMARSSWQTTQATPKMMAAFKSVIAARMS